MAETGVDIQVRTKADLAALEETNNKLAEVKTVAEQLAAAGAKFDPKTNSFVSTMASDAGKATEGLKITRYELAAIAQQLVTGNVTAQSLSRSLSALSLPITAAALAGFALERVITAVAEEELKAAQYAAKQATEIRQAVERWDELVQKVRDLGGEVRLADKIRGELAKMELDMADFRTRQLPLWESFGDKIAGRFGGSWTQMLTRMSLAPATLGLSLFTAPSGPPPLKTASDQARQQAQERYNQLVRDANIELDRAKQKSIDWAAAEADLPKGIQLYTDRVADLTIKLERLDAQRHANLTDPEAANAYGKTLSELNEAKKSLEDLKKEQEDLNNAAGRETATRRELTALMREQATVLQGIRQQQELISVNPFMGADEKQTALLASYMQEMQLLSGIIQQTKAAMHNSALDPAQYTQLNQKLQQSVFEFNLLGVKVAGLKHPFTTELVQWAGQFSSASHQAATALTNTLGTAINSTSQALTGLIFQTGNWRQSMAQAAESIVSDLIRIALQFVISRTIMAIVNRTLGSQESGTVSAQAGAAFVAWEPAAIAASTASYGVAASVGLAAFLAALSAGMAGGVAATAAGGGAAVLHGGGPVRRRRMHSGGLADDEVPIIAQEGEIMIQRSVAQQPGMAELLLGLNAGMFHSGGFIRRMHGGGDPWSEPDPLPGTFGGPVMSPKWEQGPGPQVVIARDWGSGTGPREERWSPGGWLSQLSGFGTFPSTGWAPFGPTMLNTFWVNYPGVGNVPMGVPPGGWTQEGQLNIGTSRHSIIPKPSHSGGIIGSGRSFSLGNFRLPRLHSGGATPSARQNITGAGQVNIHNYTDLKTLVKEMATRKGRNIIVDTVRGSRIDLGIR